MVDGKAQIFLSYCWADDKIADEIYAKLAMLPEVNIHRDKIDIGKWKSIKAYMQSISNMDFTILLISDSYLKSSNCMYEVLEVMRDRNYSNRIFPAVIFSGIYNPIMRAKYVKYWQDQYQDLKEELNGIEPTNLSMLSEDLKRYQDIAANIVKFLDTVSDMNNPELPKIAEVIKTKIVEAGYGKETNVARQNTPQQDLFSQLGINKYQNKEEFTDLDINQFVVQSYQQVIKLFTNLCKQFENENSGYTIVPENIDSRNNAFQFYKDGMKVTGLKIILEDYFGDLNIAISKNTFSSGHSWNGLYTPVNSNGKLVLKATMTLWGEKGDLDPSGVVKDIWEQYVAMYLR